MRLYLFHHIDMVSANHHSEGGLAIVANDKVHALEMLADGEKWLADGDKIYNYGTPNVMDSEWDDVVVYELSNDEKPTIYAFPNAGCC